MCAVWVASRSGQALPASVVKLRRKPVSVLSLNAVRVSLQFCTSLLVGLRVSEVFSYLPKILISEEVWSRQTEAIICAPVMSAVMQRYRVRRLQGCAFPPMS